MNTNQLSITGLLKLGGCLLFDLAAIFVFFRLFSLFALLAPIKSLLMLLVLAIGLVAINGAVLFASTLNKRIGTVYTAVIVCSAILYGAAANALSIVAIAGSASAYVLWELLLLAAYFIFLAVILRFAKREAAEAGLAEIELEESQAVNQRLLGIEALLLGRQGQDGIVPVLQAFKSLKERMQASTPFGRVLGNRQVMEIERSIHSHLEYIQIQAGVESAVGDTTELQKYIEETRRLVKNREALMIR
ncbi:hypothetical protein ACX93W_17380 [Paenibacillus sp. CAU 1782]